jgi:multidrug efflux pump subunit AcrA (membrane-fusion protein)
VGLLALLSIGAGTVYWLAAPPSMTVVHPRRGPAVEAVYATGTVEPTVMVPISAHNIARLVELDSDEGSTVVKGQVLAKLEDDDLRRAVEVTEGSNTTGYRSERRNAAIMPPRSCSDSPRFVARISSRAKSALRVHVHVRRMYSGRPSSSMRFSDATAIATSAV